MNAGDPVGGRPCAAVEDSLAELALGSLAGDARVGVLTHLQGCERCRTEAEQLAAAADSLLLVAPPAEPPVGFEVAVFERIGILDPAPPPSAIASNAGVSSGAAAPGCSMGAASAGSASAPAGTGLAGATAAPAGMAPAGSATPSPVRRLGEAFARLSRQGRVALAAAAVVIALAASFGGGWLAGAPAPAPVAGSRHSAAVTTATLRSGARDVGTVSTFAGRQPWLLMTVHGVSATGEVACEVTLINGRHVRAGSFRLHDGYGAWGVRLPAAATAVHAARVVTPDGAVIASAVLRHHSAAHAAQYPQPRGA